MTAASTRVPGHGTGDATLDLPGSDGARRASVYLHAGEVFAAARPTAVITVLGSCVAVCLCDPIARVGGMNHFLLPHPTARDRSARFGEVAMARLLEEVLAAGASPGSLQAKVFGGASMARIGLARDLGRDNAALALGALEAARVPVVESDLGGRCGRKLVFHTDVGSAWLRFL